MSKQPNDQTGTELFKRITFDTSNDRNKRIDQRYLSFENSSNITSCLVKGQIIVYTECYTTKNNDIDELLSSDKMKDKAYLGMGTIYAINNVKQSGTETYYFFHK